MSHLKRGVIYKLPLTRFPEDCDWAVEPLARTANILGGGTPDTEVTDIWEPPEIPWATPTDITGTEGNEIVSTARYISEAGLKQSTLIPENSVLMTSRATIGAVADRDVAKGHRLDQPQDPHPLFRLAWLSRVFAHIVLTFLFVNYLSMSSEGCRLNVRIRKPARVRDTAR